MIKHSCRYYIYKIYKGTEKVLTQTYRNEYIFIESEKSNLKFYTESSAYNYLHNNYYRFKNLIEKDAEVIIKSKVGEDND